jgi:3-hydroxyacyl-CoA dehydrogenase
MDLAPKIRKVAVVSGVCHGFIGNRMLRPAPAAGQALLMEGAAYNDIDDALLEFGFPMGPFQMGDLAGLDIGWHRDPTRIETDPRRAVRRRAVGAEDRQGLVRLRREPPAHPSSEVKGLVADFAAKQGAAQRAIGQDEIRERLLYPMINEGAKVLDEGIAQRASDIDVVWLNGYGWPAWTGGPMYWASHVGLDRIVAGLERYGLEVSPYLRRKAEAGQSFD